MTKLKPCPFCGSTNLQVPTHGGLNVQKWWCLSVRCHDCGINGPHVNLNQHKADGNLYAHGSRRPKSAVGQRRWDDTIDRAIALAIENWNKRV